MFYLILNYDTYVLLTLHFICLAFKSFIFFRLFMLAKDSKSKVLGGLISLVLFGSMFQDFAWIIKYARLVIFPSINPTHLTLLIRFAWIILILQYQALALFIESLDNKKIKLKLHNKIFVFLSLSIISFFIYHSVIRTSAPAHYENLVMNLTNFLIFIIFIPTFISFLQTIKNKIAPRILGEQVRTFILFIVLPHLFLELISRDFFNPFHAMFPHTGNFLNITSSILLTYALYFCSKRIIGMRFLNMTEHVEGEIHFNFVNDIKEVLKELGHVTSLNELKSIISNFYKTAFLIPPEKTKLYIKSLDTT